MHKVVIVGGGFGGLYAAKSLRRAPVGVTLVDRRNFHLFQPLLYQVATGGLSPANIAYPLRATLKHQANARVVMAEVTGFDVSNRCVQLSDDRLAYDTLVVAVGAGNNYFGHDAWEKHAPGLKTIEDATAIRAKILRAFEAAERETDPARVRAWLTFVIVGAGPTGAELAGALAEIARHTLKHDFRNINPADAHIVLVEASERVLGVYPPALCDRAAAQLERLGVALRLRTRVTDIQSDYVALQQGEQTERLPTHTVVWAAGVQASPLGTALAQATGAELDRGGRIIVAPDCTVPGHPEIIVLGDLAHCRGADGKPLPGIAPVAIQQGYYAARLIAARLHGETLPPFRYVDRGSMATIGRAAAVALVGDKQFSGLLAWLLWLFIHLYFLIAFQNRLLVLLQWAWNYITWGRSARLITDAAAAPTMVPPKHS